MIEVNYSLRQEKYSLISVKGHAGFGDPGKDLICSAVSSIFYGLMNALDEIEVGSEIYDNEEVIEIRILNDDEIIQNYIHLVLIQLKTIEYSYGDYIKIRERK